MSYGYFNSKGDQYIVTIPKTPNKWYNYHFNKEYYMEVTQTAQGGSTCLIPSERNFTRGYRYFYVHDEVSGDCWNPNHVPLKVKLDNFECINALGWTEIKSSYKEIETSLKVFVPLKGLQEIWIYKVKNNTESEKALSLYSVFSFESGGMGPRCEYFEDKKVLINNVFPYYIKYEDQAKLENNYNNVYMLSDDEIASFECSEKRFFGGVDTTEVPVAITAGSCSNLRAEIENTIGVFQHRVRLNPGEEKEIAIVVGCSNSIEEAAHVKTLVDKGDFVKTEFDKVNEYWSKISDKFIINTPDKDLNNLTNYWLKKQLVAMNWCHRFSMLSCVRNELQDAVGYSMLDGEDAVNYLVNVMKNQESNGYLKQWHMLDGSADRGLALLHHKDGAAWLIACTCAVVQQYGDISLLQREVEFKGGIESGTIYDHVMRAVNYMLKDRGAHGLSHFGDGDWTDPINGAGRLGRGESVWTTMALQYGIQEFLPLCEKRGYAETVTRLKLVCKELDAAINQNCWDGSCYICGYDDDGVPFGAKENEEGRFYLNPQTWAIMAGNARDGRLEKVIETIDRMETFCGSYILQPAFMKWNGQVGKISIKRAGGTENGAVYCHGSMFKAYADCIIKRGNEAYRTMIRTMPTNPENPPERNLQVPTFVPNYYFGLKDSPNFGHSSNVNSTGTCSWALWVTLEFMLGARATVDGLLIEPCVPEQWKCFSFNRDFKKARYNIKVANPIGVQFGVRSIKVNSEHIEGNILPYIEGKTFEVEVLMG
jgi:cellobiose phosphorylase